MALLPVCSWVLSPEGWNVVNRVCVADTGLVSGELAITELAGDVGGRGGPNTGFGWVLGRSYCPRAMLIYKIGMEKLQKGKSELLLSKVWTSWDVMWCPVNQAEYKLFDRGKPWMNALSPNFDTMFLFEFHLTAYAS